MSLNVLAASCDEFLVHGVDVEGMKLGIDERLVELLGRWSPIPVTYAGGARSIDDLEKVRVAGAEADAVCPLVPAEGGSLCFPHGELFPYATLGRGWRSSGRQA